MHASLNCLPKQEKLQLLACLEERRRRDARETLDKYARYVVIPGVPVREEDEDCEEFYPDNVEPASHHRLLLETLMRVANGEIKRLMIFMPPGTAKSTYASVVFPTWIMGRRPQFNVIHVTYGADLAKKFGRKCRAITRSKEYQEIFATRLLDGNTAADDWALENGSTYMCGGILSGITGNRADGLIIDDPIKGREEADSETIRSKVWEEYKSSLRTRLKPRGWQIIIQTRWHEEDLAGKILPEDYKGETGWITSRDGEDWYVLCLQAKCEREDDPLGRKVGEWLWTEWFTPEFWVNEQRVQGARNWAALYQQRPAPLGGGEFKQEWLQHYRKEPSYSEMNIYILVDPAHMKKKTSDWTAMIVWGLAPDHNYYLLDMIRDKLNPTERINALLKLHRKWKQLSGKAPTVGYEEYGRDSDTHYLKEAQEAINYRFHIVPLGGHLKKEDRIRRLIPIFEQRRIYLPLALYYTDYTGERIDLIKYLIEKEMGLFPSAPHDDVLDAMARICDEDLFAAFPQLKEPIVRNIYGRHEPEPQEDWMSW